MSFECSNREPMNDQHACFRIALGGTQARSLWLKAQFLGCALLLAACGGGGAADQGAPSASSDAPAPAPAPAPSPAPSVGTATLSWVAPQTNADGSTLSDLAGYRIYYGTGSGNYTDSVTVSDPQATTYTVANLSASTYYFVLRAFDKSNVESAPSAEVSKTVN
jgi:hypothetical protein